MRFNFVARGVEARFEGFVVLRVSINCDKLVGRVLINPSTLLIAGAKAIANVSLVKTKVKEYHHMHGRDMLGRLTLMLHMRG